MEEKSLGTGDSKLFDALQHRSFVCAFGHSLNAHDRDYIPKAPHSHIGQITHGGDLGNLETQAFTPCGGQCRKSFHETVVKGLVSHTVA